MKLNISKPLIIFDLETTGLDLVKDRIIQISYIKVYPDGREDRKDFFVNPLIPIPQAVTDITGINDDMVKDAPCFKDIAAMLNSEFEGCDFAGFNSNRFDVPLLAEEFLRADVNFNFSKSRLIDAQVIYHKMEKRNLAAAYKFYCGRNMDEDYTAHKADQDTEATYKVLQGMMDMYSQENQTEPERIIENSSNALAEISKTNDFIDFAGRLVWQEVKDANGNVNKEAVFNFGKHKGVAVSHVFKMEPGYYTWMMNSDFAQNTKQMLTMLKLKEMSTNN